MTPNVSSGSLLPSASLPSTSLVQATLCRLPVCPPSSHCSDWQERSYASLASPAPAAAWYTGSRREESAICFLIDFLLPPHRTGDSSASSWGVRERLHPASGGTHSCQSAVRTSTGSVLSCRQEHKVIIHVHHRHIERGHLIYAERLVPCRVQLLHLQLPLHALHRVESCSFVLLSHQQARLGRKTKPSTVSVLEARQANQYRPGSPDPELLLALLSIESRHF